MPREESVLCSARIASDFERLDGYHALRHSFVSILVSQDKTWDQIAAFVGHLDQRTTQWYIQFMTTILPASSEEWLREIARAFLDAEEAQPFGERAGKPISERDLFHLAPHVFIKFRDLRPSKRKRTQIVEATLASYAVTMDEGTGRGELRDSSILSFAFCYLAAHRQDRYRVWGHRPPRGACAGRHVYPWSAGRFGEHHKPGEKE